MARIHPVISSKVYQSVRVPLAQVMEFGPGAAAPDEIVLQSGWLLHELDFRLGCAVFLQQVETKPIFAAPFAYQEQVASARNVAMLPFADFLAVAKRLNMPQRLIHLFNIGHCGSTLLHQVFNTSGAAQCISESKFSFDLPTYRSAVEPTDLTGLAEASLRFLTLLPGYNPSQPLVLKHFSQACRMIETWASVSPDADYLFLYRDALSWANSRYGFVQRRGLVADVTPENKHQRWQAMSIGTPESFLEGLVDMNSPAVGFEDFAAVAWSLFMCDFVQARANGVKLYPFRYNELVKNRAAELADIFTACNLPLDHLNAALAGFEKPSHAGTSSDRSKPARILPADAGERMARILRQPKLALYPDMIL